MEAVFSSGRAVRSSSGLMHGAYAISLALLSAALLTAAFPPFDVGLLAWIGMAPLLYGLRRSRFRRAVALSLLTGLFYFTGTFFWAGSVALIGVRNWLLCVVPLSLYFVVFGAGYWLISKRLGAWLVVGAPALWVALEYVRSNLSFIALPWNLLGHSQYRWLSVIQIADVTGVYGISFIMVMVSQLLSQVPDLPGLFRGRHQARGRYFGTLGVKAALCQLVVVILTLTVVWSYGGYRKSLPGSGQRLRAAIVQGNVLTRDDMSFEDQAAHLDAYVRLSRQAAADNPDIIIWPASSLPAPIKASRLVRHTIRRLAHETECYFLVGGSGYEKFAEKREGYSPYANSMFLISPDGRLLGQYNKIKLVPFNEYLPLQGRINWPGWITTLPQGYQSGKQYTLFKVKGSRFGSPICWENLFPGFFSRFVRGGANFMVSATNEGFYGRSAAPLQTLAMNVFRAAENKVPIARAAPTGISAFIDANGKIAARVRDGQGAELFVPGYLVKDVVLSDETTFYTAHGDLFARAMVGIALLCVAVSLLVTNSARLLIRGMG